jgi:predicted unusual protein kinase regulating ubiquinone biosynthesis (AarF/ABC1/UbiB family)
LLTNKLLDLGPTFIKLGQVFSSRIDIVPKEYIEELSLLQDQVPGFSGDVAVQIIEQELGKPINQLFDYFNRTSLAAASLGQVHVATLNGKRLAVKIQRQGLKQLFDMDLKNIKVLAQIFDKIDPKSDGTSRNWVKVYDESARLLYKEIDYEAEALNAVRFKDNFASVPWVKVPDVYLNMTTDRVITMEYVPGIKINDIQKIEAAGIDRNVLAKRSAESYLSQLCRHGFFHCDPHPGNVACDAEEGGRLIYYDFGMMDELSEDVRRGLVNLIFGIYENDAKEACDGLEQVGVLRQGVDRSSVEKIARFFLKEFQGGIAGTQKWASQLSKDEQRRLRKKRTAQLASDLFTLQKDSPFVFPPTFTFVFRAFTTLDGIGKGLDPLYDLTKLAQPFLKELVDLKDGSVLTTLLKTWGKKLGWRPIDISNAVQSPRKVAYLAETVTKMEQGDLKLRVRVLESEESFAKMELVQQTLGYGVATATFLNVGMLLATIGSPTGKMSFTAKSFLGLAGICGINLPLGFFKLNLLNKKFQKAPLEE